MRPLASLASALVPGLAGLLALASCSLAPGYHGGRLVCGCSGAASCYQGAADTAQKRGETAESAETLLYYAQCACLEGSRAGCTTLAHFAEDWTTACASGEDVAKACTIAGLVWKHGVQVPKRAGPSFDADPVKASAAFGRACEAGNALACRKRKDG